jgi:competence protein ComEA
MASAIGDAQGVDLNTASAEQLDRVGGLGHDRVQRLIQSRPFRSWDDVKQVEGFGDTLVEDLKKKGATLGGQGQGSGR